MGAGTRWIVTADVVKNMKIGLVGAVTEEEALSKAYPLAIDMGLEATHFSVEEEAPATPEEDPYAAQRKRSVDFVKSWSDQIAAEKEGDDD